MPTTISVSEELADELYALKGRGESYEDVIWRLLEEPHNNGDEDDHTPVAPTEERDNASQAVEQPTNLDAIVDQVADEVLPGAGAKLEARREALRAAVEFLREHGTTTPSELQEEVYPEHNGMYTEGEDPAHSWWKNCVYKGLREVANRSDQVLAPDTSGEWRYRR
jgi:predicted CopG family antitoxin